MELVAIEGNTQRLDGGAMYGNAPRAVWRTWSEPDEENRILLACRALLVVADDGRRILFEAGIGAFFEPKLKDRFGVVEPEHRLLENLARAGASPDAIDAVVLSHLHFDHAGGLLSAHGDGPARLVFPRARFYVGRRHWERATSPHARDRASFIPVLHELLTASGRLALVDNGDAPPDLAGVVARLRISDGHTPGLVLSEIATPGGPLVFAADLVPGLPWVHAPITMGYDRYPERLIDEKSALLEELSAKGGALFFTHDPKVPAARVRKDSSGRFRGEPVSLGDLACGR